MGTFLNDLRHGLRQLRTRPGFTLAAVASLALGIGLNTTLFSVVNAVLLKGGAIAAPERLVEIYTGVDVEVPQLTTSYPDYLDVRAGADTLSDVAANAFVRGILSSGDRPALVTGEAVTASYFEVLGVPPRLGRGFRADENVTPNASAVIVLSHGLWQRRFGARPSVVGETVTLSGGTYTIVGVAPPTFSGTIPGIPTEFWVPLMMVDRLQFSGIQSVTDNDPGTTRLDRRGTRWLFVKGRLAEGRTIEEARAQIETIFARLRTDHPATNEKATVSVLPAASVRFHPLLDGYVRAASAALLAAVSLVLLIACANVANMLLARGAARRRELALRAALGASRGRVVRQLLTEGVVLAALGGVLGVVLAWWAGSALEGFGSDGLPLPISFDFAIDPTVLLFALGASASTAILFGLAPAWSASTPDLIPALKASPEGDARRRFSLRNVLVVGQLALSLVLLVAGALLARGLLAARHTDLGFDPTPVAVLAFNPQMNGYDQPRAALLRDRAIDALRALPGVAAVSTASRLPLAPDINLESIHVPGRHNPGDEGASIDTVTVGAQYFEAAGIPILYGRPFTGDEVANSRRVAIVNETMARQYWPDGSALGRRVHTSGFDSEPYEVVGVARDHKVRSVGEDPRPYLHLAGAGARNITLIVRSTTPAQAALPMLRAAVWELEPSILFTEDAPASNIVAATVMPTRLAALALGAFGALALLLAAVGLYGVIAYSVGRRTREIGLRLALGAERGAVIRLILAQGSRLALVGVAIGVAASAVVGTVLESLLYGVSRFDPLAYAAAAAVLLGAVLAANLVPALAAARVDPLRALRSDS